MAAQPRDKETLANIRQYAATVGKRHADQMDYDASDTETRLKRTVQELQARVREQQAALEEFRTSSQDVHKAAYASGDKKERLQQLRAVKDAYKRLTPVAPFMPTKGSVLPALLATRTLQQNIQGTKEAITSTQEHITKTEVRLRREELNLRDANLITKAMENRIERLGAHREDRSRKTSNQLAKELIEAKEAQKLGYEEKMKQMGHAFDDFVELHLAAMLAAEELGGPVVGDMLDVENDTLAAGFTRKGKAKALKKQVPDKKRQKKITEIWGDISIAAAADDDEPLTEAEAADIEMRKLVENLFTTLMGPGGNRAYYGLERDSAASRFLVRAKIAQFDPKDAKRLRLIDFGRELDD
ncbi:hypothetical protein K504DRAFT_538211 [Pleomassaria siparia CBS 279.74]|uniref:Uncharacterized protein n=1 Tax=Pleomassaria siparia CBS 279.74 TaxID=1314801 RepID=A0A6G1JUD0_9PLEO|nr:hypothetical protein K504DRAFT_538211 [Pleomassaria siparia CBS 279.74]